MKKKENSAPSMDIVAQIKNIPPIPNRSKSHGKAFISNRQMFHTSVNCLTFIWTRTLRALKVWAMADPALLFF